MAMVNSTWLTILDSLSLILMRSGQSLNVHVLSYKLYVIFPILMVMGNLINRSQGEAIILEILKGYQAFTQVIIVVC
jgi:hypothetical protein